jgi:L-amino acid N-acyltransferase
VEELRIRDMRDSDLAAVNAIYNHYVEHSTCTYQLEPETDADRATWFREHGAAHPLTVAERPDGAIVGWAALSPFHHRCGYAHTTENSVYVDHAWHRRGIGGALLADLVARTRALGHHTIVAAIDGEQGGSIALHRGHGFADAGRLRDAGFKFGRWLDVVYLQLML